MDVSTCEAFQFIRPYSFADADGDEVQDYDGIDTSQDTPDFVHPTHFSKLTSSVYQRLNLTRQNFRFSPSIGVETFFSPPNSPSISFRSSATLAPTSPSQKHPPATIDPSVIDLSRKRPALSNIPTKTNNPATSHGGQKDSPFPTERPIGNTDYDFQKSLHTIQIGSNTAQTQKIRRPSRTYKCVSAQCEFEISNLKKLGDHMRDHHGMQAFKCDQCDTQVTRYDNLQVHQKNCKGGLPLGTKRRANSPRSPRAPTRSEKRQRVNFLSLQNTITLGSSSTSKPEPSVNSTPTLPFIVPKPSDVLQGDTTQSYPHSQVSSDSSGVLNIHPRRTNAQLISQIEALQRELHITKEELEQMRCDRDDMIAERDIWRREYFQQRKQPDVRHRYNRITATPAMV
ncbi:hypothetical protein H072_6240 [Dactylellina haptotyla CBS 200.50]|uniref:C2H2-type domain-containing protein n=1 Tax=Dactylellina haptotyla (strain CBS 200.50) TaxID=1284197 RepID=S8AA44_DACHA|nr:hypothetical protein H072_6240 [Dactylellina haptotyla CBS 200.50]